MAIKYQIAKWRWNCHHEKEEKLVYHWWAISSRPLWRRPHHVQTHKIPSILTFYFVCSKFFIWGGFLCDHSWFPWNRDLETQTLIHVQSCDEQDCLNNKSHYIQWISICIYRISVCIYRILLFPKSVCVCQKQFLCRCPNLNWFHHVDKKTKNNALIVNIW